MAAKTKPVDEVSVGRPRPRRSARSAGPAPARRSSPSRRPRSARPARSSKTTARPTEDRRVPRRPEGDLTAEPDPGIERRRTRNMALGKVWVSPRPRTGKVGLDHPRAAHQGPRARRHRRGVLRRRRIGGWPRRSARTARPRCTPPATSATRCPAWPWRAAIAAADRGRQRPRPDPVRHDLRRPRHGRPPVGQARQAGAHQHHRRRRSTATRSSATSRSSAARRSFGPSSPAARPTSCSSGPSRSPPRSAAADRPRSCRSTCPTSARPARPRSSTATSRSTPGPSSTRPRSSCPAGEASARPTSTR